MNKLVVAVVLGFLSGGVVAGGGQYHVCTDADGKKTFTSNPCGVNEAAEVRTYKSSPGASKSQPITTDNPIYQQMKSDNRRADVLRSIKTHRKNIDTYGSRMNAELAVLKRKKLRANNNIAGAAYEMSISEEMNAVTSKYTTLIGIERDRMAELNSELAQL